MCCISGGRGWRSARDNCHSSTSCISCPGFVASSRRSEGDNCHSSASASCILGLLYPRWVVTWSNGPVRRSGANMRTSATKLHQSLQHSCQCSCAGSSAPAPSDDVGHGLNSLEIPLLSLGAGSSAPAPSHDVGHGPN